jgi:alkylation response protein AidB-like acyl-CoA dehydrogenase
MTDMETDNFSLSEEQTMILDTVRKFAVDHVEPKALEHDEHGTFVRGSFDSLGELGMLGIPVSEASGGAEMGLLSMVVALEELGRVCGSTARLLLSQSALCGIALEGHAEAEAVAGGEKLGAFVGLEAWVTATASGDGFTLSGAAALVTAATEADLVVVAARTAEGEVVLACIDAAAVERAPVQALGFRATAPGSITLDGVVVAAAAVVARGAEAQQTLDRVHVAACIGAGAIAVGTAEASRKIATAHAKERIAFGKPLARQQAVALKLADAARATQAARHLVYHAARLADAGRAARITADMARLAAIEAAVFASDEAIQILGGYGFTVEYHVERHYRDSKTLEVMEGGAEQLRDEIAALALA